MSHFVLTSKIRCGNIVKYFRGLYLTKTKNAISSYLIKKEISIHKINAYLSNSQTL
jgi:hypothetical protein